MTGTASPTAASTAGAPKPARAGPTRRRTPRRGARAARTTAGFRGAPGPSARSATRTRTRCASEGRPTAARGTRTRIGCCVRIARGKFASSSGACGARARTASRTPAAEALAHASASRGMGAATARRKHRTASARILVGTAGGSTRDTKGAAASATGNVPAGRRTSVRATRPRRSGRTSTRAVRSGAPTRAGKAGGPGPSARSRAAACATRTT